MTRYCPSCKAEVSDTGGFCLLGHRLPFEPAIESLRDLRAEVEDVFEAARLEVAAVLETDRSATPVIAQPQPAPAPAAHAPAPPAAAPAPAPSGGTAPQSPPSPPAPRPVATSTIQRPQPPSGHPASVEGPGLWSWLDQDSPIKGDPIEAFAPPPRMDWGPERTSIFRRRSHARRPSTAVV